MPSLHENPDEICREDWWLAHSEAVYGWSAVLLLVIMVVGVFWFGIIGK